ncbi:hypothetical protein CBR_g17733 [Chara braunii]|uniref:Band 7 domain-containing protein n=1 Tax=Chara braunii TaxID=69332 RepID=A0A388KVL7_CHABU|nr:hypothetical protein CBR_g17733 [Chara braunii]|eukprot:GBG74022.1 hypothetical protein CBR_g17733 [Chara braunii]
MARRLFDPEVRRDRVTFEGANAILYVAKAPEVAAWMVQKAAMKLTLRGIDYPVVFKPWMTKADLKELRLKEAETNFWIVALRVSLEAFYYLASAVEALIRGVRHMHPSEVDRSCPKLMNVKFDMEPQATYRVENTLAVESPKGEIWKVELATPYTEWCRRCRWYFHTEDTCPKSQQADRPVRQWTRSRLPRQNGSGLAQGGPRGTGSSSCEDPGGSSKNTRTTACRKWEVVQDPGVSATGPQTEVILTVQERLALDRPVTLEEVAQTLKDNVFVNIIVSVQYRALEDKAYDAFYRLSNPQQQIQAYVFDVVRASVPRLNIDTVFEQKDDIARNVKMELDKVMGTFGYDIQQTLITDIAPDAVVKRSMNEINAAARLRVAATDKAEAEKIAQVKRAEAEAEAKYLSGLGIARQRQAIVDGLRESVLTFSSKVEGTTPKDVLDLVLVTQYFDTMKDIGSRSKNTTVFMPSNPSAVADIASQVRMGFLQGAKALEGDGQPSLMGAPSLQRMHGDGSSSSHPQGHGTMRAGTR